MFRDIAGVTNNETRSMKTLALWLLWISSIGVAFYALFAYLARPVGSTVHPQMMAVYAEHRVAILVHIFCSVLTLMLGPPQFMPGVRKKWPAAHRVIGRVYLGLGVLGGGLAGLYMAFVAFGGAVSTVGFAMLAVLWLATGFAAFTTARSRRFAEHRRWMIRNFALAFAAVTLRVQLGLCAAADLEFESFYPALAWTSWIPNLLVAEFVLRRNARA
jgi:hypothetical protein